MCHGWEEDGCLGTDSSLVPQPSMPGRSDPELRRRLVELKLSIAKSGETEVQREARPCPRSPSKLE